MKVQSPRDYRPARALDPGVAGDPAFAILSNALDPWAIRGRAPAQSGPTSRV